FVARGPHSGYRQDHAVQQAAALRLAVRPIYLIPLSNGNPAEPPPGLDALENLAVRLARMFRTPCQIRPDPFDISFAEDAGRHQYHSTAILQRLERANDPDARILG